LDRAADRHPICEVRFVACARDLAREPEVEQLDAFFFCHGDVRRLQIPMDDPFRMRGLKGLRDLRGDAERVIDRDRSTGDRLSRISPSTSSSTRNCVPFASWRP